MQSLVPMNKVPTSSLRAAALRIAKNAGIECLKINCAGMFFATPDGKRVRLRTNNDRCLLTRADNPDPAKAKLDIEQDHYLLFCAPTVRRGTDKAEAYFVPMSEVASTLRRSHAEWLTKTAKSKGRNITFAIWLDGEAAGSTGFAQRWVHFRLGEAKI